MANLRFADLANLKALFAGLKGKYEPKDSTIVKDASYVHTDTNFTQDEKTKLSGIATGATANSGTVTSVATGVGLTGGTVTSSGTVKANLKSETAHSASSATPTNTADRQYPVGVDADGYLSVNVPWEGGSIDVDDDTIKINAQGQIYVALPDLDSASF